MPGNRFIIFVILSVFCLTSTAWASEGDGEDAPYAPERLSIDELIVTERFQSPPLAFPWDRISSERVAVRGRRDFALLYDVDFDTVRQHMRESYEGGRDFIVLEPEAMRYLSIPELRISGLEMGDDRGRISVGHPDMEPMFTVDIEADGQRTLFTIQNLVRTRQFSGFMPTRVDFLPIGADAVNFRYN